MNILCESLPITPESLDTILRDIFQEDEEGYEIQKIKNSYILKTDGRLMGHIHVRPINPSLSRVVIESNGEIPLDENFRIFADYLLVITGLAKKSKEDADINTPQPTKEEKPKGKKKGQSAETELALIKLRQIRKDHIMNGTVNITKAAACDQANISSNTVRKYDPELFKNWKNSQY